MCATYAVPKKTSISSLLLYELEKYYKVTIVLFGDFFFFFLKSHLLWVEAQRNRYQGYGQIDKQDPDSVFQYLLSSYNFLLFPKLLSCVLMLLAICFHTVKANRIIYIDLFCFSKPERHMITITLSWLGDN